MNVVLHYDNQYGKRQRVWRNQPSTSFRALVKYYIQGSDNKLQVIEKSSTRPASLKECLRFAEKLKRECGRSLKQIYVWNLDSMEESYPEWCNKNGLV